ncbi:MAG: DNA-directed RNA polymerase subunit omega [Thermodesulfobacteriota bacterium]
MARVTVEDCLKKVSSRFVLVNLAKKRVQQLRSGAQPLVQSRNKEIVVALREIAAGKVTPENVDELGKVEKGLQIEGEVKE